LLVACATRVTRTERHLERERARKLATIDVEACEAGGGELRYVCMFGMPSCVQLFSDGGKPCSSSSECHGLCVIRTGYPGEDPPKAGQPAEGRCELDDDRCGCWIRIEDGIAQKELCVD